MDTRLTPRLLGVTLVAALVFIAAIIATAVLAAHPATATAAPLAPSPSTAPSPGVTVSGRAQVEGVPDTLRLDMGVNVVEDDVETALAKANEATAKLHTTLRENGVAERDHVLPAFTDRMRQRLRAHCEDRQHQPWPSRGRHTRHRSDESIQQRVRAFEADVAAIAPPPSPPQPLDRTGAHLRSVDTPP